MTLLTIADETEELIAQAHDPVHHDNAADTIRAALEVYAELENPEEMRPDPEAASAGVRT